MPIPVTKGNYLAQLSLVHVTVKMTSTGPTVATATPVDHSSLLGPHVTLRLPLPHHATPVATLARQPRALCHNLHPFLPRPPVQRCFYARVSRVLEGIC